MSTTIRCLVQPPLPEAEQIVIDGKNLADAFVGAALGVDLMALMESGADLPENLDVSDSDAPNPFDPISPFIDKQSGFIGQTPACFFPPSEGLLAVEAVLRALHAPSGVRAVPNPDLRQGAVYDLEQSTRLLQCAQQHGALFTFYMEQ